VSLTMYSGKGSIKRDVKLQAGVKYQYMVEK